jgi:hypothetical protein
VGDTFEESEVISIDLSGVRLRGDNGERRVPFRPHPLLVDLAVGGSAPPQ